MRMKRNPGERLSPRPQSVKDLLLIIVCSLIIFAVSATFDFFNKIITWMYRHDTWQLDELFTVSIFLIVALAVYAWRRQKEFLSETRHREQAEAEKAKLIPQLQSALNDVSRLKRLLPICASCKKVRDDRGYWSQVEVYIEAQFHTKLDDGICPDCAKKLYGRRRTIPLNVP
jgi:hypothetical protein